MIDDEKRKALDQAILQIEKKYGKGSIMRLGEEAANNNIESIPTGCLTLDVALGIGGIPRGRITEIYGPESSGKTTVCLHMIAEAQKMGGTAAFVDAEHALDPVYAAALGVDLDNLYISQPDNGEDALNIVEFLVKSNAVDLIVVDSVAALVPKAEIEGEIGDATVASQARLMSQALRKLAGISNRSKTSIVFTNQLRMKIGVMFGNPETTPGGYALKFYSSVRLDVRRADQIKDGANVTGNRTKIKVVKNKVAPPFKTAEFDIMYGKGISQASCILELSIENNLVEKSGSWFSYKGDRIGQGKENVKDYIDASPALMKELEDKIRAIYFTHKTTAPE